MPSVAQSVSEGHFSLEPKLVAAVLSSTVGDGPFWFPFPFWCWVWKQTLHVLGKCLPLIYILDLHYLFSVLLTT